MDKIRNGKSREIWLRYILVTVILIVAVAARAQPHITFYQPAGWSDKVVVTTNPNSTTDTSGIVSTNEVYVDWAVANLTAFNANSPFDVDLYKNSVYVTTWEFPDMPSDAYGDVSQPGWDVGQFPVGTNTVEIVADSTSVYGSPTSYTKTFVVYSPTLPPLTAPNLISPANGSINQSTSPVFTWSAVSNAASYEIFVATNAADLPSNTNATSGGTSVVIAASVSATNFTPVNPLNAGTKFYWEVNARFASQGGPWSSTWNFTTASSPPGLTILPVFDSTITSDPNAWAIESTIRAACSVYQSAFSDPITVSITFQEMGSGLGQSSFSYYTFSYSAVRAALVTKATTADDSTALAHLPVQTGNPVNGNQNVQVKNAQAYDLGLVSGTSGENVGTISLYTAIMNLSGAQTDPSKYSLFSTVCHEIDEVLATGSALDQVYNGGNTSGGPIFTEDLFRYDGSGNRNYTTSSSQTSYFSIDGITDLAQFNQVSSGDFGDWYSYNGGQVPEVQDAFATAGASPNPVVELRVLDVLGYHRVVQMPAPNFVSATRSGNTIKLIWTSVSGSNYQLLSSTNLNSSVWNTLGSSIPATNSTASYSDTIGTGKARFYRVELLSAPSVPLVRPLVGTPPAPTGWATNVFNPSQP